MPSIRAQIGDAVRNAINAAHLSLPFKAKRRYYPASDIEQLQDLTVTVFIRSEKREALSRTSSEKQTTIDVGIQQRLPQNCDPETEAGNDAIDLLMQLAEEIAKIFEPGGHNGPDLNGIAGWIETTIPDPLVELDHLYQYRTFTSVVSLTFQHWE